MNINDKELEKYINTISMLEDGLRDKENDENEIRRLMAIRENVFCSLGKLIYKEIKKDEQ